MISAVIGVIAVSLAFGDAGAPTDATIAALPHGIFSSFGYTTHDKMAALPNSLLALTLTSNFGTFILYGLSCLLCIVAYSERHDKHILMHYLIPGFGLLANLTCMAFYLAGPFFSLGTKMEPLTALGISAVWGLYGAVYFLRSSKAKGKAALLAIKSSKFRRNPARQLSHNLWVDSLPGLVMRGWGEGTTQSSFSSPALKPIQERHLRRAYARDASRGGAHVRRTVRPGKRLRQSSHQQ